jgi:hypothetical protein
MQIVRVSRLLLLPAVLIFAACPAPARAQQDSAPSAKSGMHESPAGRDGQHDFDFEFGIWKAHLRRLLHPLTGSNSWIDLEGASTVRKVWDGRANLGELQVDGPTTHIEGLSLRLYNPQSHQWSIYWAASSDGDLSPPMVGQFDDGRGVFFDHESFQGKPIDVRFVFSDITPTSFRFEQSFSADGRKTWEPNWVATFSRLP